MRQTGEIGKRYAGDEESAKRYLGLARVLLGRMKAYLAGVYGSREWKLADGTVIVTKSMPHGDLVTIQRPEAEKPVEFSLGGILCIPVADEAPFGWGEPITDDNAPLGTIGGGPPRQAWLQARSNGKFEPTFKVKRYTDIDAGTIQWRGRGKKDRLWFKGPPSRYFVSEWSRASSIWTIDNKKIATPGGVYGCAIYREGDGSGLVVAAHVDVNTIAIHIRKAGEWDQIGTVAIEGSDSWLTCCHFSPRGNKAAIVTFQGSVIEIDITYNDIDVSRTDRMAYRYRNTRSVTQTVVATRSFTLDEDPNYGTFTGSENETLTTTTTWSTELLTVSPDNPSTILSASSDLTWERPICADFNTENELIVGKLKYEGAPRFHEFDNGFTTATYNAFAFPIDEIPPIDDINWWTVSLVDGQITGVPLSSGIDSKPPVNLNRPAPTSVSGTSTIIQVNNNSWSQTVVDLGNSIEDWEDEFSLSTVSSVSEAADIASLTITLVVTGSPEWTLEVFHDLWSVTYTRNISDASTGEFEGSGVDTNADGNGDLFSCTAHRTADYTETEHGTQTIDVFAGRLRYVNLQTLDVLMDTTERRKYNDTDGGNRSYSYDLTGGAASVTNAGIIGSFTESRDETITRSEAFNQSFRVVLDGETASEVFRYPGPDPDPEVIPSSSSPSFTVNAIAMAGQSIYVSLAAKGESTNTTETVNTVKSASYDARCETSRQGDSSTAALYANRALFFSGPSWDGAISHQNPLYLDLALRDAPAIFGTAEFTDPRFGEIRSF